MKENKHIPNKYGGHYTVSPNVSDKTLQMLEELTDLAYNKPKPSES